MDRQIVPVIPENWNTIVNPRDGLFAEYTYSHFHYDQVSSALQKSVRRCLWPEAAQWFLEAFRTGPKCKTNILRRLFIYCSEDIGPANPSLILLIDDMFDVDKPDPACLQEIIGLIATMTVTKSPKCRMFDWIACSGTPQEMPTRNEYANIKHFLFHLEDALQEKDFDRACTSTNTLYRITLDSTLSIEREEFMKMKEVFKATSPVKHFTKPSELFWLPVLGASAKNGMELEASMLVHRLYHIACKRSGQFSFRYKDGCLLFWIHAIWAICNPQKVVETWYAEKNHRFIGQVDDYDTLVEIATKHAKRIGLLGVPDYALDKHTQAGRAMRRDLKHFVEEGCVLMNRVEELIEEEDKWKNKMIAAKESLGLWK